MRKIKVCTKGMHQVNTMQ